MTALDLPVHQRPAPIQSWVFTHGAAVSVAACALFWAGVGAVLYYFL